MGMFDAERATGIGMTFGKELVLINQPKSPGLGNVIGETHTRNQLGPAHSAIRIEKRDDSRQSRHLRVRISLVRDAPAVSIRMGLRDDSLVPLPLWDAT